MNEHPTKMRDAMLLQKHGSRKRTEKNSWEDPATGWVRERHVGPSPSDERRVEATASNPDEKRLT
jgi:hypothetical protein